MTDVVTEGGCLCGAIRYHVRGQPTHSMICHCRTCRKAAGSPVVAWLTLPLASRRLGAADAQGRLRTKVRVSVAPSEGVMPSK